LFCPKCGTENDDSAAFCASCGTNLKTGSSPPMGPPAPEAQPVWSAPEPSGMDIRRTFSDAIALVRSPKSFMAARADSAPPLKSTMLNYVAVLAAIPFIFTLLGHGIFPSGGHGWFAAVVAGIIAYIEALLAVLIVGFILWKLAPRFMSLADQNQATKLVSYVYTPVFLIAVVNIIPVLSILNILALLYGLYILYVGLPIVLKTPQNKVLMYVITTLVVTFIVYAILALINAVL
jgi:hypothetical protein